LLQHTSNNDLDIPCLYHLCAIRLASLTFGVPEEHLEKYMTEEDYECEIIEEKYEDER
jgi:hypothetical protein